jgi:hypothetical protein
MTQSEKLAAQLQSAARPRPGSQARPVEQPVEAQVSGGLELSEILYKPLSWFRHNPENAIFRALKSERYFADLERDIREAGEIITPLIAMPDGLLIEGESRVTVAGRLGISKLPVRIVLSELAPDEQRKRLWLGNLSRFEIDEDTRLLLYARIWPGYFKGDTVSPPATKAEIAEATGKSERQVVRDKRLIEKAAEYAEAKGRDIAPEDVKAARGAVNEVRRGVRGISLRERVQAAVEELKARGWHEAARIVEDALK